MSTKLKHIPIGHVNRMSTISLPARHIQSMYLSGSSVDSTGLLELQMCLDSIAVSARELDLRRLVLYLKMAIRE